VPGEEVAQKWNEPFGVLRSAPAQAITYMAARWALAQANMEAEKQKPSKPIPAVQRPGVARSRDEIAYDSFRDLDQKLSESGKLRDAMRLRSAQIKVQRQRGRTGP
jgi:hypothetical protein